VTINYLLESFLDVNMVNLTMVSISNLSKFVIQPNKKLGGHIYHTKQKNWTAISTLTNSELGGFVLKKVDDRIPSRFALQSNTPLVYPVSRWLVLYKW
jgi:hypothetical protein